MSRRDSVGQVLQHLGAGAWFGGSLMGAVGLNGASRAVHDPTERVWVASAGWARWAPVNVAAVAAHLGGTALAGPWPGTRAEDRPEEQGRPRRTLRGHLGGVVQAALTVGALASTAYSGVLGAHVSRAGRVATASGVVPSAGTPAEVAESLRRLRVLQWATPALTGGLLVLGAAGQPERRGSTGEAPGDLSDGPGRALRIVVPDVPVGVDPLDLAAGRARLPRPHRPSKPRRHVVNLGLGRA